MTSIIKVDTIQDIDGNNIINENADTITIGASGDTITIPAGATIDASGATVTLPTTIEVDAVEPQSGTTLTLGASGDTVSVPTGATLDVTNATVTGLPASGKVLQVVSVATTTESSSSSSTFADVTNLTATITPSSLSNKILVTVFCNGVGKETNNAYVGLRLLRGASVIAGLDYLAGLNGASGTNYIGTSGIMYQDSPSTTSATTYKVQISSEANNATAYINRPNGGSVPSSTITLMEVSA